MKLSAWAPAPHRVRASTLREQIDEKLSQCQSILDLATEQDAELSASDQKKFDAIFNTQIPRLQRELEQAEEEETKMRLNASSRRTNRGNIDTLEGTRSALAARPHVARLKAFSDSETAYACGHWLKAALARTNGRVDEASESYLAAHGINIQATLVEGDPTKGGYVVPDQLLTAFIEYRERVGIARQLSRVVPMSSEVCDIPILLSGMTVKYVGESGEIIESDETWGSLGLVAKKRAILTKMSRELRDDAIIDMVDQVISRMSYDFARQEDKEFFLGDATSTYGGETGVLNAVGSAAVATAAAGHDTWAEIDLPDITAWMGLLPSQFVDGAVFITSSAFYHSVMVRLLAAGAGNAIASLEAGPDGQPTFLGKPVYFTDYLPTTGAPSTVAALYGNFDEAVLLGDRMALDFTISDQRYFEHDLIGIRGVTRYDINVHNAGTASVVGAFTAFKTSA